MKQTILIRSERNVSAAVAAATRIASSVGFDPTQVSAISTAVSEVARNIVKYADHGQVTVSSVEDPGLGIEVTARDRGPGIADVDAALRDHYSTGGTLGLGLPGVRRLMDEVSVESTPGSGTTVTMRMMLRNDGQRGPRGRLAAPPTRRAVVFGSDRGHKARLEPSEDSDVTRVLAGSFVRSHQSETTSGDLVVLRWIGSKALIVVLDALGHGPRAARIAANANQALAAINEADVLATLGRIDKALTGSDGAAAGVAIADPDDRTIEIASVGNVRIRVLGPEGVRISWTEGTLGAQFRRPQVQHRLLGRDTLVMYSDGVRDHFRGDEYPGAQFDAPDLAAKTIVERFGKDYDDSSCAVVRFAP
jgi:anti-sigma regulatory factor (Ser/Thr protein kinase)